MDEKKNDNYQNKYWCILFLVSLLFSYDTSRTLHIGFYTSSKHKKTETIQNFTIINIESQP